MKITTERGPSTHTVVLNDEELRVVESALHAHNPNDNSQLNCQLWDQFNDAVLDNGLTKIRD